MEHKKLLTPQLVKQVREAAERLYNGLCMVEIKQSKKDPKTKKNKTSVVQLYVGLPCRLSHDSAETGESRTLPTADQKIKLFIAPKPEVDIPANSRITITQDGVTEVYGHSGVSNNFPTHQEIELVKWDKWA